MFAAPLVPYNYGGCSDDNHGKWTRKADVKNSFVGAETCQSKCKAEGFKYWGLECPREHYVHCQCSNEIIVSSIEKCPHGKPNSGSHCKGPFTSTDGKITYYHGAGDISSIYATAAGIIVPFNYNKLTILTSILK